MIAFVSPSCDLSCLFLFVFIFFYSAERKERKQRFTNKSLEGIKWPKRSKQDFAGFQFPKQNLSRDTIYKAKKRERKSILIYPYEMKVWSSIKLRQALKAFMKISFLWLYNYKMFPSSLVFPIIITFLFEYSDVCFHESELPIFCHSNQTLFIRI